MRAYSDFAGSITSQGMPAPASSSSSPLTVCDLPAPVAPAHEHVAVERRAGDAEGPGRLQARVEDHTQPQLPGRLGGDVEGARRDQPDPWQLP